MEPPEFANDLLDFSRHLEGENRDSTHPDDAEHWHAVYRDLVQFKEQLLSETKDHIKEVPDTRSELGRYDVPFLEAELGRLRSGQAYWQARLNPPQPPS
jgi:hypothetical protein